MTDGDEEGRADTLARSLLWTVPKDPHRHPAKHIQYLSLFYSDSRVHKRLCKIHTAQNRKADLRRPSPGGTLCTQSLGSDATMELSVTKGCPYLVLGSLCQQESQWLVQHHSHQSLALLLDSLLQCLPPRQLLLPQTQHGPATPIPGPLSFSPVAPAEEDTGKEECPLWPLGQPQRLFPPATSSSPPCSPIPYPHPTPPPATGIVLINGRIGC